MTKNLRSTSIGVCILSLIAAFMPAAKAQADLVLSKNTVPPGQTTMQAGGLLRYLVTVVNQGPGAATNLSIVEEAVEVFVESTPSAGANCSDEPLGVGFARKVTCTWPGETPVGGRRSIEFAVRACGGTPCNSILNLNAAEANSDVADPTPLDSRQTGVGGSVPGLDIEVFTQTNFETDVTANTDSTLPGGAVSYSIDVSNLGPSSSPTTTVIHQLPPGWTVDSVATTSGFPAQCSGEGTRTARCDFALQSPFICVAFAPGEETMNVVANVPSNISALGVAEAVTSVASENCLEDLGDTSVRTTTRVLGFFFEHFAQFGGGGGFTSDILLTNPTLNMQRGTVFFYDEVGDPLLVELVQPPSAGPVSHVEFDLEPEGGVRISTSPSGPLALGSATVNTSGTVGGVVRFSIPGIGIAGVGTGEPLREAIVPVRESQGVRTGLAIRNLTDGNLVLSLSLRGFDGVEVSGGISALALSPRGRSARFLNELFPAVDLEGFEGVVVVNSPGPIAVTALELGDDPGEFTTLPVTELGEIPIILESREKNR